MKARVGVTGAEAPPRFRARLDLRRASRFATAALALPVALPLLYLVWLALDASPGELWTGLVRAGAGWLILKVTLMGTGATLLALLIGAPWAWLVTRTDVPGRRFFRWLGPLPLAIPPYVGALAYAILLAQGGMLHNALADVSGRPVSAVPFPSLIYGPAGAAFVLGLFTAPYVFLNVHGALGRIDTSLEEAARGLGHSPREVLRRVTLPMLRPALLAGGLLAFVYVWVDFGVVSLLRARTFTTVLFTYLRAGFSLPRAAGLSLVLVAIVWALLLLQHRALGSRRYSGARARSTGGVRRAPLGVWRWPALAFLVTVSGLTLGLPLGVLTYQMFRLGSAGVLLSFLTEQLPYLWNSFQVAFAGSLLALGLAGVLGWQGWRGRSGPLAGLLLQGGYSVPGTVLGLSLIGLSLALFPPVYGTPWLLALAYVVLFAAPTLQGVRVALAAVPVSMEEAVRALGYGPLTALRKVVAPLAWPGLAATWLLTFVLALRELAATLILRPPGFDTLPVRIWVRSTDVGLDPQGATLGLVLVVLVGLPWLILLMVRTPGAEPEGESSVGQ